MKLAAKLLTLPITVLLWGVLLVCVLVGVSFYGVIVFCERLRCRHEWEPWIDEGPQESRKCSKCRVWRIRKKGTA